MRYALVLAAAAIAAGGLWGCSDRQDGAPQGGTRRDESVVRFWESFHEATRLRLDERFSDAESAYREALAIDPRHEDSLYYLGQCRLHLSDPRGAREAFETLIEVNPVSARGHLSLGALLASPRGAGPIDAAVAEAHFRRAHEINGEETAPMLRLGEVLILLGRRDEALGWLEAAFGSNPRSVEAAFLSGYLLWEAGDDAGAGAFYARAAGAAVRAAPVEGVLGEGDRRTDGPAHIAPPPLANPMGETLFGDFSAHLRDDAAGAVDPPDLDAIYGPVRAFARDLARRAAAPPS